MKYISKSFKLLIVFVLIIGQFTFVPVSAMQVEEPIEYVEESSETDDLFYLEDIESDYINKEEIIVEETNELVCLSDSDEVVETEILFAGEGLEYEAVPEECIVAIPSRARNLNVGHGLVQFTLEPVNWNTAWGTLDQARTAAMNSMAVYHRLFANATTNTVATAVNGRFGRDALLLGESNNRLRVLIAGFVGYVPRDDNRNLSITATVNGTSRTFNVRARAVVIPFGSYPNNGNNGNVRSMSFYENRNNGELWRILTNNVNGTNSFSSFLTGPAPTWMPANVRFYSYDGVFFYRNPRHIRIDGSGAENANNPHFNYFQYLSFRSHSTVDAAHLNWFLGIQNNSSISVMRNSGQAFINAGNRYGINATLMFAKALHESAAGTSAIARNNNNLFGLGAFDATPGQSALSFPNVAASINDLANGWLSRGFLWPGNASGGADWRFEGAHAGHKGSGMNVRYATDPYWGQKIAGWAFRIDRNRPVGQRDMNRETIAVRRNGSAFAVRNDNGSLLYNANIRNGRFFPVLVTGNATNNRFRVKTHAAIVNNQTNRTALFNRSNAIGFVENSNVWLTGNTNLSNVTNPPVVVNPPVNPPVAPPTVVNPPAVVTPPNNNVNASQTVSNAQVNNRVSFAREGNNWFIWGLNNDGQLGNGNRLNVLHGNRININTLIPAGQTVREVVVAFNNRNVYILTNQGNVFASGANNFGQRSFNSVSNRFNQVNPLNHRINAMRFVDNRVRLQRADNRTEFWFFGANNFNVENRRFNSRDRLPVLVRFNSRDMATHVWQYNWPSNRVIGFTERNAAGRVIRRVENRYNGRNIRTRRDDTRFNGLGQRTRWITTWSNGTTGVRRESRDIRFNGASGRRTRRIVVTYNAGGNARTSRLEFVYSNGRLRAGARRYSTTFNNRGVATRTVRQNYNAAGNLLGSVRVAIRA